MGGREAVREEGGEEVTRAPVLPQPQKLDAQTNALLDRAFGPSAQQATHQARREELQNQRELEQLALEWATPSSADLRNRADEYEENARQSTSPKLAAMWEARAADLRRSADLYDQAKEMWDTDRFAGEYEAQYRSVLGEAADLQRSARMQAVTLIEGELYNYDNLPQQGQQAFDALMGTDGKIDNSAHRDRIYGTLDVIRNNEAVLNSGTPAAERMQERLLGHITEITGMLEAGRLISAADARRLDAEFAQMTASIVTASDAVRNAMLFLTGAHAGRDSSYKAMLKLLDDELKKFLDKAKEGKETEEEKAKAVEVSLYVTNAEEEIEGMPTPARPGASKIFARGIKAVIAGNREDARVQRELAARYAKASPEEKEHIERLSNLLAEGRLKAADVKAALTRPALLERIEKIKAQGKPVYAIEIGEIRKLDKEAKELMKRAEELRKKGKITEAKKLEAQAASKLREADSKTKGLVQIVLIENELRKAGAPEPMLKAVRAAWRFYGTASQWRADLALKLAKFFVDNKETFKGKNGGPLLDALSKFIGILAGPKSDEEIGGKEKAERYYARELEPKTIEASLRDAGAPEGLLKAVKAASGFLGTKEQWRGQMILRAASFFLRNREKLTGKGGAKALTALLGFVSRLADPEEKMSEEEAKKEFGRILSIKIEVPKREEARAAAKAEEKREERREPEAVTVRPRGLAADAREKAVALLEKRKGDLQAMLPYVSEEAKVAIEKEIAEAERLISKLKDPAQEVTREDVVGQARKMIVLERKEMEAALKKAGAPEKLVTAFGASSRFIGTENEWRARIVIDIARLFIAGKNDLLTEFGAPLLKDMEAFAVALADPSLAIDQEAAGKDFITLSENARVLPKERSDNYKSAFQKHKIKLLKMYRTAPPEFRPAIEAALKSTDEIIGKLERGEQVSDDDINWIATRIGMLEQVISKVDGIKDKELKKQATAVYLSAFSVLAKGKEYREQFDLLIFAAEEVESHPGKANREYRNGLVKSAGNVASAKEEGIAGEAEKLVKLLSDAVSGELRKSAASGSARTRELVLPVADNIASFSGEPAKAKVDDFYRARAALKIVNEMNSFLSPERKMDESVRSGAEKIWNRGLAVIAQGGDLKVALSHSFLAEQFVRPRMAASVLEDIEGLSANLEKDPSKLDLVKQYLEVADKIVGYREKMKGLPKDAQKVLGRIITELEGKAHLIASGQDVLLPEQAAAAEAWVRNAMEKDGQFGRYVASFAEQSGLSLDAAVAMIARQKWMAELLATGDLIANPPKEYDSVKGGQKGQYFGIIGLSVDAIMSGQLGKGGTYRDAAVAYTRLVRPADRDDLASVCRDHANNAIPDEKAAAYFSIYRERAEYESKIKDKGQRANATAYFDMALLAASTGNLPDYELIMDMAVGYASWAAIPDSELTPDLLKKKNEAIRFFEEQLGDYSRDRKRITDDGWAPRKGMTLPAIASAILIEKKPVAEKLGNGDLDAGASEMQRLRSEAGTRMGALGDVEFERKWLKATGGDKRERQALEKRYKRAGDWIRSQEEQATKGRSDPLAQYYALHKPIISYGFVTSAADAAREFYVAGKKETEEALRLNRQADEAIAAGDTEKGQELRNQAIEHARTGRMLTDRADEILESVLTLNTGVGIDTKHRESGWLDLGISIRTSVAVGRGVEADAFGQIILSEGEPVPLERKRRSALIEQADVHREAGTRGVREQQAVERSRNRGLSLAKKEIKEKNLENIVELVGKLIDLLPEDKMIYDEVGYYPEPGGRATYLERIEAAKKKAVSKNKAEAEEGLKELQEIYSELCDKVQVKRGYADESGAEVPYYDAVSNNGRYWKVVGHYYNENFAAADRESSETRSLMRTDMDLASNRITARTLRMEIEPLISEEGSEYGPYFGKSFLNTIGYVDMPGARFVIADEIGEHIDSFDGYDENQKKELKRRIEEIRAMPAGADRNAAALEFLRDTEGVTVKGRLLFSAVPGRGLIGSSEPIYYNADWNEELLLRARKAIGEGDLRWANDELSRIESDMEIDSAIQREDNKRIRSKVTYLSIKNGADNLENELPPIARDDSGRGNAEKEDAEEARKPLIEAMKQSRYRHAGHWDEVVKKFRASRDQMIKTRKIFRATPDDILGAASFLSGKDRSEKLSNGKTIDQMIGEVESAKTDEERIKKAQELAQAVMSEKGIALEFAIRNVDEWGKNYEQWKRAETILGRPGEAAGGAVDLDPDTIEKMVRFLPDKVRKKKKLPNGKTYTAMLIELGRADTVEKKRKIAGELFNSLAGEAEDYRLVSENVRTRNRRYESMPEGGASYYLPMVAQSAYMGANRSHQQYKTAWAYQVAMYKKFDEQLRLADDSNRTGRGGRPHYLSHLSTAGDAACALLTAASGQNDYRFFDILKNNESVDRVIYSFQASKSRPWHEYASNVGKLEIKYGINLPSPSRITFAGELSSINHSAAWNSAIYVIAWQGTNKQFDFMVPIGEKQTDFELGMLGIKKGFQAGTYEAWHPTDEEFKLFAESFEQFSNVRTKMIGTIFGYSDSWGRDEEEKFLGRVGERMDGFHRAAMQVQEGELEADEEKRVANRESARLIYGMAVPFTKKTETDYNGMPITTYEDGDELTKKYYEEMEEERSDHNASNMFWKIVRIAAQYALSPFTFGITGAAATAELTYDGLDAAFTYYDQAGGWEYMSGSQKGRLVFMGVTAVLPAKMHIMGSAMRGAGRIGAEVAVGETRAGMTALTTGQRILVWENRILLTATTVDLAIQMPDMWQAYKKGQMSGLELFLTGTQGVLPLYQAGLHARRVAGIKRSGLPHYRPRWQQAVEALVFGEPFDTRKEHRMAKSFAMAKREYNNLGADGQQSYDAYKKKYGVVFEPAAEADFLRNYNKARSEGLATDFESFAAKSPDVRMATYDSVARAVSSGDRTMGSLSDHEYVYLESLAKKRNPKEAMEDVLAYEKLMKNPEIKAMEDKFHAFRRGEVALGDLAPDVRSYVENRVKGKSVEESRAPDVDAAAREKFVAEMKTESREMLEVAEGMLGIHGEDARVKASRKYAEWENARDPRAAQVSAITGTTSPLRERFILASPHERAIVVDEIFNGSRPELVFDIMAMTTLPKNEKELASLARRLGDMPEDERTRRIGEIHSTNADIAEMLLILSDKRTPQATKDRILAEVGRARMENERIARIAEARKSRTAETVAGEERAGLEDLAKARGIDPAFYTEPYGKGGTKGRMDALEALGIDSFGGLKSKVKAARERADRRLPQIEEEIASIDRQLSGLKKEDPKYEQLSARKKELSLERNQINEALTSAEKELDSAAEGFFNLVVRGGLEAKIGAMPEFKGAAISRVKRIGGLKGVYEVEMTNGRKIYVKEENLGPARFGTDLVRNEGLIGAGTHAGFSYDTGVVDPANGNRVMQEFGFIEDIHNYTGRTENARLPDGTFSDVKVRSVAILGGEVLNNPAEVKRILADPADPRHEVVKYFYEAMQTPQGREQVFKAWRAYQEMSRRGLLMDRFTKNSAAFLVELPSGEKIITFQPIDTDGIGYRIYGDPRDGSTAFGAFDADFAEGTSKFMLDIERASRLITKADGTKMFSEPLSYDGLSREMFGTEATKGAMLPADDTAVRKKREEIVRAYDGQPVGLGFDATSPEHANVGIGKLTPSNGRSRVVERSDGRVTMYENETRAVMERNDTRQSEFANAQEQYAFDVAADWTMKVAQRLIENKPVPADTAGLEMAMKLAYDPEYVRADDKRKKEMALEVVKGKAPELEIVIGEPEVKPEKPAAPAPVEAPPKTTPGRRIPEKTGEYVEIEVVPGTPTPPPPTTPGRKRKVAGGGEVIEPVPVTKEAEINERAAVFAQADVLASYARKLLSSDESVRLAAEAEIAALGDHPAAKLVKDMVAEIRLSKRYRSLKEKNDEVGLERFYKFDIASIAEKFAPKIKAEVDARAAAEVTPVPAEVVRPAPLKSGDLPVSADPLLAAFAKIEVPGTDLVWGVVPPDQLPQWKSKVWKAYEAAYRDIGLTYANEEALFSKPRRVMVATDQNGEVVAFVFLKETEYGYQRTLVGAVPGTEGKKAARAMIDDFGNIVGAYGAASGAVAAISVKAGIPVVPFEKAQMIAGTIPADANSPGAFQNAEGKWVRYEAQRGDGPLGMEVIRKMPGFAESDLVKHAIGPDGVRPGAKPEELTWNDLVEQAIKSRELPDNPDTKANSYAVHMIIDGKPQIIIKTMFGSPRLPFWAQSVVRGSNTRKAFVDLHPAEVDGQPGYVMRDGQPIPVYHSQQHTENVARTAYDLTLARARNGDFTAQDKTVFGTADEKAKFMGQVGILHDADPTRTPGSPARVAATLEWMRSTEGRTFMRERFGWDEKTADGALKIKMAEAIIQRTEFPFDAKTKKVPTWPGDSTEAAATIGKHYETKSPVDHYTDLLKELDNLSPDARDIVLREAPFFSEYADKSSWYFERPDVALLTVSGLTNEAKAVVPPGVQPPDFLPLTRAGFLDTLGKPDAFAHDTAIAKANGWDEPKIPAREDIINMLPEAQRRNWEKVNEMFGLVEIYNNKWDAAAPTDAKQRARFDELLSSNPKIREAQLKFLAEMRSRDLTTAQAADEIAAFVSKRPGPESGGEGGGGGGGGPGRGPVEEPARTGAEGTTELIGKALEKGGDAAEARRKLAERYAEMTEPSTEADRMIIRAIDDHAAASGKSRKEAAKDVLEDIYANIGSNDAIMARAAITRANALGRDRAITEDLIFAAIVGREAKKFTDRQDMRFVRNEFMEGVEHILSAADPEKVPGLIREYGKTVAGLLPKIYIPDFNDSPVADATRNLFKFAAAMHAEGIRDPLSILSNGKNGLLDVFPASDRKSILRMNDFLEIVSDNVLSEIPTSAAFRIQVKGKIETVEKSRAEILETTLKWLFRDLGMLGTGDAREVYMRSFGSSFEWGHFSNDYRQLLQDSLKGETPKAIEKNELPILAYTVRDQTGNVPRELVLGALENDVMKKALENKATFGAVVDLLLNIREANRSPGPQSKAWLGMVSENLLYLIVDDKVSIKKPPAAAKELLKNNPAMAETLSSAIGARKSEKLKNSRQDFMGAKLGHINSLWSAYRRGGLGARDLMEISQGLSGKFMKADFEAALGEMYVSRFASDAGLEKNEREVLTKFAIGDTALFLEVYAYRQNLERFRTAGNVAPDFHGRRSAFDEAPSVLDRALIARAEGKFREFKFSREFQQELSSEYSGSLPDGRNHGEALFEAWRQDYPSDLTLGGKKYSMIESGSFEEGFEAGMVRGSNACQHPKNRHHVVAGLVGSIELPWIKQVAVREPGSGEAVYRRWVFLAKGDDGRPVLLVQPEYHYNGIESDLSAIDAEVVGTLQKRYAPLGVDVRIMPNEGLVKTRKTNDYPEGINTGYSTFRSGRSPLFYIDSNMFKFKFGGGQASGQHGLHTRKEGESIKFGKGWEKDHTIKVR